VTIFGDKTFKETIKLNEAVGALTQDKWPPYKTRHLGCEFTEDDHTKGSCSKGGSILFQMEGRKRTVIFKTRRETSKETTSASTLILDFQL
jgi:hypothetical protein